jgi:hypothetical protein
MQGGAWRRRAKLAAPVLVLISTGMATGGDPPAPGAAPETLAGAEPGATVLLRESQAWALEGELVAEAQALLSAEAARAELGDAAANAGGQGEGRARALLRRGRSAQRREAARTFVDGLDRPTRELLEAAGRSAGVSREDIFMDYLTYEGLYDLALMRYGWRRREAAAGPAKKVTDDFFAATKALPSAKAGISVGKGADGTSITVDVFGATVRAAVVESRVEHVPGVGSVGKVEWRSSYEALRAAARGQLDARAGADTLSEVLPREEGGYRVSYAVEVDDYLSDGDGRPWATLLYLTSADEVADLYAGVAAAGGLASVATIDSVDPAGLPVEGLVGTKEAGLSVRVAECRVAPVLAGAKARRGKFALVTVELRSTLATPVKAPSDWFALEAGGVEYPEVGVTRPGLGATVHALVEVPGARMLGLPAATIAPKSAVMLVLVFEVPRSVNLATLRIGARELALKVVLQ